MPYHLFKCRVGEVGLGRTRNGFTWAVTDRLFATGAHGASPLRALAAWVLSGGNECRLRREGSGHAIADAPVVEDVGRLLRVVGQLAPELLDEDAHQVGVIGFPAAPHLAQQGVVGQAPARR